MIVCAWCPLLGLCLTLAAPVFRGYNRHNPWGTDNAFFQAYPSPWNLKSKKHGGWLIGILITMSGGNVLCFWQNTSRSDSLFLRVVFTLLPQSNYKKFTMRNQLCPTVRMKNSCAIEEVSQISFSSISMAMQGPKAPSHAGNRNFWVPSFGGVPPPSSYITLTWQHDGQSSVLRSSMQVS